VRAEENERARAGAPARRAEPPTPAAGATQVPDAID
jgi:hypothetical protein